MPPGRPARAEDGSPVVQLAGGQLCCPRGTSGCLSLRRTRSSAQLPSGPAAPSPPPGLGRLPQESSSRLGLLVLPKSTPQAGYLEAAGALCSHLWTPELRLGTGEGLPPHAGLWKGLGALCRLFPEGTEPPTVTPQAPPPHTVPLGSGPPPARSAFRGGTQLPAGLEDSPRVPVTMTQRGSLSRLSVIGRGRLHLSTAASSDAAQSLWQERSPSRRCPLVWGLSCKCQRPFSACPEPAFQSRTRSTEGLWRAGRRREGGQAQHGLSLCKQTVPLGRELSQGRARRTGHQGLAHLASVPSLLVSPPGCVLRTKGSCPSSHLVFLLLL